MRHRTALGAVVVACLTIAFTSPTHGASGIPSTPASASPSVPPGTSVQYDSAGRITSITSPDDRVTTYTYDASNEAVAIAKAQAEAKSANEKAFIAIILAIASILMSMWMGAARP